MRKKVVEKLISMTLLGLWLLFQCPYSIAFENTHLLEDAAGGDREAQYTLAHLYLKGKGGVDRDIGLATSFFRRAAEAGHRDGMYDLAMVLLEHESSDSDTKEALYWLNKSAELNHRDAQFALGRAYGLDYPDKGVYWLKKAAENDHLDAVKYLKMWCESQAIGCEETK